MCSKIKLVKAAKAAWGGGAKTPRNRRKPDSRLRKGNADSWKERDEGHADSKTIEKPCSRPSKKKKAAAKSLDAA